MAKRNHPTHLNGSAPSVTWRQALGGELSASDRMAEYAKLRKASPVDMADWLRACCLDRLKAERNGWATLPAAVWSQLAEDLAEEASIELQSQQRMGR